MSFRRAFRILAALGAAAAPTAVFGAEDSGPRLFAAHALDLRAESIAGGEAALDVLAAMPGAAAAGGAESLELLWRPFFENAIVKLGRLRSPAPVALYYNPLLDVAVVVFWRKRPGGYEPASVRALPGDHIMGAEAEVSPRPAWIDAALPVAALRRSTEERLAAFRRAHPAEAFRAERDDAPPAAFADMRAALPRLAWNLAMRVGWAEGDPDWLAAAAARTDSILASRDTAVVAAMAPETDAETAAALASLPEEYTDALALDMALGGEGEDRLLIASDPGDGAVYVFALCRLDGGACALRRLFLVSLEE